MDRRDRVAAFDLFQRDLRRRVHLFGGELGLTQDQGQRHRKTTRVRRCDQLFGVTAALSFKSCGKSIRIVLESAALCRNGAFAVLESAPPDRRAASNDFHFIYSSLKQTSA